VLCGFSARMPQSCWYHTDIPNLVRYIRNRLTHIYDWEADLSRLPLLQRRPRLIVDEPIAKAVAGEKLTESQN